MQDYRYHIYKYVKKVRAKVEIDLVKNNPICYAGLAIIRL